MGNKAHTTAKGVDRHSTRKTHLTPDATIDTSTQEIPTEAKYKSLGADGTLTPLLWV